MRNHRDEETCFSLRDRCTGVIGNGHCLPLKTSSRSWPSHTLLAGSYGLRLSPLPNLCQDSAAFCLTAPRISVTVSQGRSATLLLVLLESTRFHAAFHQYARQLLLHYRRFLPCCQTSVAKYLLAPLLLHAEAACSNTARSTIGRPRCLGRSARCRGSVEAVMTLKALRGGSRNSI